MNHCTKRFIFTTKIILLFSWIAKLFNLCCLSVVENRVSGRVVEELTIVFTLWFIKCEPFSYLLPFNLDQSAHWYWSRGNPNVWYAWLWLVGNDTEENFPVKSSLFAYFLIFSISFGISFGIGKIKWIKNHRQSPPKPHQYNTISQRWHKALHVEKHKAPFYMRPIHKVFPDPYECEILQKKISWTVPWNLKAPQIEKRTLLFSLE